MVTLMSRHQSARRERERERQDDTDGASATATSWFLPEGAGAALGVAVAGLATASTAIACLAISQSSSNPPAVDDSSRCYYLLELALSGLFYTGIAELSAAVWVMAEPRGRGAAGRRLVYASIAPLTVAAGLLAAATLFWLRA